LLNRLARYLPFSFQYASQNQSMRFPTFREPRLTPKVLFAFRAIDSNKYRENWPPTHAFPGKPVSDVAKNSLFSS
jgi:hypothetical protein